MSNDNSNVDLSELDRFNRLANEWWDDNGPMKPLHILNPVRLGFVQQYATLENSPCLDIGCGGGLLSEAMATAGGQVSALDLSTDLLEAAKLHASENNLSIDYHATSAEAFAQANPEAFDTVTCMEMLEHVPDPSSIVQAASDACKPGGYVFFSTLNRNAKSFIKAIVGAEYVLSLLPKGTHEYAKFIKPSELCRYAREAGLELLSIKGIDYNPFQHQAKLTDDTSVNYIAAFKKA